MRILEAGFGSAICEFNGERRQIDTMLIGEQKTGTWVLVFIDAAREVIDEKTAFQIRDALKALDNIRHGDHDIEHLFKDIPLASEQD